MSVQYQFSHGCKENAVHLYAHRKKKYRMIFIRHNISTEHQLKPQTTKGVTNKLQSLLFQLQPKTKQKILAYNEVSRALLHHPLCFSAFLTLNWSKQGTQSSFIVLQSLFQPLALQLRQSRKFCLHSGFTALPWMARITINRIFMSTDNLPHIALPL